MSSHSEDENIAREASIPTIYSRVVSEHSLLITIPMFVHAIKDSGRRMCSAYGLDCSVDTVAHSYSSQHCFVHAPDGPPHMAMERIGG